MVCAFDMSLSVEGSLCRKCSSPSATTMCQDHLEYVEGAEDRRVTFTRQNPGPELKVEGSRGTHAGLIPFHLSLLVEGLYICS